MEEADRKDGILNPSTTVVEVEESGIMQEFERTAERLLEDADKTARRTGKDTWLQSLPSKTLENECKMVIFFQPL